MSQEDIDIDVQTLTQFGSAQLAHQGETQSGAQKNTRDETQEDAHGLIKGDLLAEYIVDGVLGKGGMGVVYKVQDPDLDRWLAVKLLHESTTVDRSFSRTRLIREARAMARLCHPNVVTIYHIGTFTGRVFIAMQYVDGGTMRSWQEEKERSINEILQQWCKAGQGLAAAHQAGLVHRDFKPDNVLVGRDGRVLVTDFGLVTMADSIAALANTDSNSIVHSVDERCLTATGAILGTPAYMAPEQHESWSSDARADQFAFSVSLYEALYGERPFKGKTYPELAMAVLMGNVRPMPKDTAVPSYIHKLLLRGLATEPNKRFSSMEEFIDLLGYGANPALVVQEEAEFVDSTARERVRDLIVVEASGRLQLAASIAEEIRDVVKASKDNLLTAKFLLSCGRLYLSLWHDDAEDCLRRAVVAAARANAPKVEAEAISTLIRCLVHNKKTEEAASMSTAGESAVLRSNSNEQRARYEIALAILEKTQKKTKEASSRLEGILQDWHRLLREDLGCTNIAVRVHALLSDVYGGNPEMRDTIQRHNLEVLRISQLRDFHHPDVAGVYCNVASEITGVDTQQALLHLQQALAIYKRAFGEWDERVAMVLSKIGNTLVALGDIDDGMRLLKQGLAMSEQILGESDLQVATALAQLGLSMLPAKIPGAEHCLLRCLEIRLGKLEECDPAIADAHGWLGYVLAAKGYPTIAYAYYEDAAKIYSEAGRPRLESVIQSGMAMICGECGNRVLALEHAEASVRLDQSNYRAAFVLAQLLQSEDARVQAIIDSAVVSAQVVGDDFFANFIIQWHESEQR